MEFMTDSTHLVKYESPWRPRWDHKQEYCGILLERWLELGEGQREFERHRQAYVLCVLEQGCADDPKECAATPRSMLLIARGL